MWFGLIRTILFIMVLITVIILFRRYKKPKRRKSTLAILIIAAFLLYMLSSLVPIENLFINFSSPQSAFNYEFSGSITAIEEGKNSTLILYSKNYSDLRAIIPKNNQGYKLGTYFTFKTLYQENLGELNVYVYKANKSNDYFLEIWGSQNSSTTLILSDNKNTVFKHVVEKYSSDVSSVRYYSYINNFDDNYQLTINGQTIEFS